MSTGAVELGPDTTTEEVLDGLDLSGTTALVTGGSGGLGLETVRALASHGARVVATARDVGRASAAVDALDLRPSAGVDVVELDLASLASVRAAADRLVERGEAFDVLVANAGVMACPQGRTSDGFETQFGTNHLGHFLFVNRLVPLLLAGAPSRVVVLTSAGHRFDDVDLDDVNVEASPYTPFGAYHRAKTANILFAVEFDRRHKARGVRATAVHPGGIQTELGRHMKPEVMQALVDSINANQPAGQTFSWKTIPQGAATSVWAAVVAPVEDVAAHFCEDCHVAELQEGADIRAGVRAYALDPERAKALWAKSEAMVGETF